MYSKSLFITGLTYEAMKREALNRGRLVCDKAASYAVSTVEALDRRFPPKVAECTGDITCERQGVRHKADCLGKVEPIDVFWKKVQQ